MVLLVLGGLLAWCVLPLPLAVLVGRALASRDQGDDVPRSDRHSFDLAA